MERSNHKQKGVYKDKKYFIHLLIQNVSKEKPDFPPLYK